MGFLIKNEDFFFVVSWFSFLFRAFNFEYFCYFTVYGAENDSICVYFESVFLLNE